ncbi:MAG: DUF6130 family protein [Ferruginibacter sp.]
MTTQNYKLIIIGICMANLNIDVHGQASAREIRGPAPVVALASEPAAKLVVDAPLSEQLAKGLVVLQYRTENLRIVPVFGPAALDVSPRIGHIHVTIDDATWHWADASNEPLIVQGLTAGPHKILVELADPTHKIIDRKLVSFIVGETATNKPVPR